MRRVTVRKFQDSVPAPYIGHPVPVRSAPPPRWCSTGALTSPGTSGAPNVAGRSWCWTTNLLRVLAGKPGAMVGRQRLSRPARPGHSRPHTRHSGRTSARFSATPAAQEPWSMCSGSIVTRTPPTRPPGARDRTGGPGGPSGFSEWVEVVPRQPRHWWWSRRCWKTTRAREARCRVTRGLPWPWRTARSGRSCGAGTRSVPRCAGRDRLRWGPSPAHPRPAPCTGRLHGARFAPAGRQPRADVVAALVAKLSNLEQAVLTRTLIGQATGY